MDSKGARRSENIRLKSARILAAQVPLYALHVQCAKCVTGSYLDVPRGLSPIRKLHPQLPRPTAIRALHQGRNLLPPPMQTRSTERILNIHLLV